MSELRSCYFCGTTAALAEYETLPADLRADDAASQQVVLCDRCQTKLTNVLAPIVDRLGATGTDPRMTESTGSSPTTGPGTDAAAQSDVTFAETSPSDARDATTDPPTTDATTDPPTTDATADESPAAEERTGAESDDATTERHGTSPTVRTGPHDEDDTARGKQRNEPDAEAGDERESEGGDGAGDHEKRDGESGDRAGGDAADGHDRDGETDEADEIDEADEADENVSRSATDAAAVATDVSATDGAEPVRDDLDRVYYKLLRFLRNREFPIPRAEAEAVAQSAYDLTAREATQVIQRAVDRDVLAERDGDLHRT